MDVKIMRSVKEGNYKIKGIDSSFSKMFARFALLSLVVITAFFAYLVLSACSSSAAISGAWVQKTTNGEKLLTISDLGDSYVLICPDGTKLSGAIYQNDEYSGPGEAYDFYLETPSIMTDDINLNEINYKRGGLLHETMYFTTKGDAISGSGEEAIADEDTLTILEGNGDSDGNKTILDGIWRKRMGNDEASVSDDEVEEISQSSVGSSAGSINDTEIDDPLREQVSIRQFVSSGYEALAIEKEGQCTPLVYENIEGEKVGDSAELAEDYEETSIQEPVFLNFENNEYDFATLESLAEDMPIYTINRKAGNRLITTADAVSLDQSRGAVYVAQDAPAPWSLYFPIRINGKDCNDLNEMLAQLYQYGIYVLSYDHSGKTSTWVSESPATIDLEFWRGTTVSNNVVTVDKQSWVIPGSLGMEGTYYLSGPSDELFETTTEGYFVVKIEDLPSGDYLVSTPDGDTSNCLIRII